MRPCSFSKTLQCTAQAQRSFSPTLPFTTAARSRSKPSQAQQLLQGFRKAWLKRLVLEQIHVVKLTDAAERLAHRAEHDHLQYYQKLHAALDRVKEPIELSKQQQEVLGVAELQGPVLDPALINNSSTLSSQDTLHLYPLHTRSSTGSRANARMRGASSTTAADSSSRKGTAGSSKSSSSKRGRKKRNKLQQIDVPAEPAQDDVLLAGMANSIQQANSLLRCNDNLYRTAVDGVDGLLETSYDLDKQAEDAYNFLMAVRSPEPQPDITNNTAQQQEPQQQEAEPEERLFAVYLPNAAGSASSSKQFVQLLRLPEQAWQYDYAQQRGMLVVPLQGAAQQPDGSHAVSAEELAWQEQQEQLYEQEQEQQDIFFGWTPLGINVSTISSDSSDNGDSTDASSDSSDGGGDSQTESSSDSDNEASCVSRIKVDVHIHIPTKPGQEVVLVGSHPQLGSWSMDCAVPLKWSDGHVWRTSIELPADCSSFEYKAVLRSSDGAVWEAGDNRQANLQGSDSFTLQHTFRCC